jgi:hypothetical protein
MNPYKYLSFPFIQRETLSVPASCKNFIDRDLADVPKSLYRRYLEVSEATFQA